MNDTAPNAGEKTLLIVDDDAPYRQRLAQAMEKRGFKVTQAESCEAAVAAASLAIREGHEIHISVPDRSAGNRSLLGAKRIECATIDCVWMDHAQSLAVVP